MYFRVCLVVLVAALFSASQALVCPQNFCDTVECKDPALLQKGCPDALVKENRSFCGCCHACVTQLAEGDACFRLLGSPTLSECSVGLSCVSGRCVRQ